MYQRPGHYWVNGRCASSWIRDPIGSKLFVLVKENELITLKNTYSNFEPIQFTAFPLDDLKQKRKETKPKVWRGSLFPPRLDHMMIFYVIVG